MFPWTPRPVAVSLGGQSAVDCPVRHKRLRSCSAYCALRFSTSGLEIGIDESYSQCSLSPSGIGSQDGGRERAELRIL